MNTVHKGHLFLTCKLCRGFICGKHKLLDNTLRLSALSWLNVNADSSFVDNQLAFGCFKLRSLSALLFGDKYIRQLVHKSDTDGISARMHSPKAKKKRSACLNSCANLLSVISARISTRRFPRLPRCLTSRPNKGLRPSSILPYRFLPRSCSG